MKIWIFKTKDDDELNQIEENYDVTMASPKDVDTGDIILVYNAINDNIKYIFEAQRKAYQDKNFRPPWKIFVDLSHKIVLKNPLERIEIENDTLLKDWSLVKENFGAIFKEVPPEKWVHLKNLILNKNHASIEEINKLINKKWFFVINYSFYDELNRLDEIEWNSPSDIKKDDIIFVYTANPKSSVGFILKALADPFEDKENVGKLRVLVKKEVKIPVSIELSELKINPIINNGNAVKIGFLGSHFKMFQGEFDELKRLIIEKNPELQAIFDKYDYNPESELPLKQRIWKITPGEGDKREMLWENFKEDKVIGIGWIGDSVNYSDFNSLDDVKNELVKFYSKPKEVSAKMIWNFTKIIKENDIIVANAGVKNVIGIGVIESDYISPENPINPAQDIKRARIYENYVHFRKVKWYITDIIEFDRQFFDLKAITELNVDKWDEIKNLYIKKSSKFKAIFGEIEGKEIQDKYPCINELFNEFKNEFLSSEEGKIHTPKYNLERQKVHKYFEIINNDMQAINNTNDPPINHLLPIKEPTIAPAAVGDIRAFGYKDEDLPGLTHAVRDLIINLMNTDDKEIQNKFINDFKQSKYKKGFQTAMLTPTLYYLKPDFWFINKKTVANFNLLSEILGENEKITGNLVDYVDNNEKLHRLVEKLKNYIPELDFESFDAFSHWMCSDNLGNYACDREKFDKRFRKNGSISLKNSFENILKYYQLAKESKLQSSQQKRIKDILSIQIPNLLKKETFGRYELFSSAWDKIHYCPYIALMNKEITTNHTEGIFVNYIFREDMSGFYLAIRQGIKDVDRGEEYIDILNTQSKEYQNKVNKPELTSKFSDKIDLKAKNASYAPFYEAGTVFSKYYSANSLPADEILLTDLNEILDIYDSLIDSPYVSLYPQEIETGLSLRSKVKEQVCGSLNAKKHIMLTGAPGTGKTNLAEDVCRVAYKLKFNNGYILTTATSDWTTYDTIGGYMPSNDGKSLKFEEGKFLQAIKENKWLIIDEINRADIDKAFGQLFTVLSGQSVELPFKDGDNPIKIERIAENRSYYEPDTSTYKVGNNWRIIATMNVFDKDYLFEMSYAFMRRFTFIYIDLPETKDFHYLIFNKWGEDIGEEYLFQIEGLLDINDHRPIGPAIFKDMIEYVIERDKIKEKDDINSNKKIIKDTVISFILPQFEGLELDKIHEIWGNILRRYDVDDDLKDRLEEISGVPLPKKSNEDYED